MRSGVVALVLGFGLAAHRIPGPGAVRAVRLASNRFNPEIVEARGGDSLRFVNGPGGPHNIEFVADSIPEPARSLLARAMPGEKIGPLSSPLLLDPDEAYGFRLPALPPGRYPFHCLPHVALGMRGVLVVRP